MIATRTKIDISKLDIPTRLDDDYFQRSKTKPRAGGGIFTESKQVSMSLSTEDHHNCCVCCRVIP